MSMRRIFRLARGEHAHRLKWSVFYKVLEVFCSAIPYGVIYLALRMLFDDTGWTYRDILLLTGITAAALIGQFGFGVLGARAAFINGYGMMCDFRLNLVQHLSRLPLGFFQDKRVGSLTATIAENVKMIEDIFTKVLGEFIACFTLPLCIGLLLLLIDWRMGVAALASAPVAFAVLRLSQKYFTNLSSDRIASQSDSSGRLLEYIDGIRVIRGFGLAGEKFSALEQSLDTQRRLSIKLEVLGGLTISLFAITLELGFVALLVVGAYGMLGGTLSASSYLMVMVLSQKFYAPFTRAVFLLVDIKYLELALQRVNAVLDRPQLPEPEVSQPTDKNDVELDNVSFRYTADDPEPALDAVSLVLEEGKTTALVGASGAGKSTVAHLIARFHDVTDGNIRIGGVDVRDMSFNALMRKVSMVLQDVYLFNDTVAANIRLGAPDATEEEVMAAARSAQCHDFIMALPDGYRTRVGEGGARLSGGQKQRISIARALLKKAPIILLDESTASIDPENEIAFRTALHTHHAGKTVLVIAHRLQTVRTADHIVVLDQGRVIQAGTHEELLAREGQYRALWEASENMASHMGSVN